MFLIYLKKTLRVCVNTCYRRLVKSGCLLLSFDTAEAASCEAALLCDSLVSVLVEMLLLPAFFLQVAA